MPTPTEQNFFLTAFKILDKHQGTQWLRKYNELLQYSPNGNKKIVSNFTTELK